jgi:hypothetical protein
MSNFQKHRYEYLYLNALRESGEVNMFGASPYLQYEFGVSSKDARTILSGWMAWANENPDNLKIF